MKLKLIQFLLPLFLVNNFCRSQSLPTYSVTMLDPQSAGYYFLVPIKIGPGAASVINTHMILDNAGNMVYYKKFPGTGTGDFKMHANGLISYSNQNKFYIMDSTFTVIDSVKPKNGLIFDGHDIQILPNGHFVVLGMENVTMNLSAYNYFGANNNSPGSATATVKCGVIQEQDAAKNVVFEWHCKDHYNFSDVDPYFLGSPNNVDWTHLNAVEYDADGNYLISVRHFNEITKIKRSDSSIMWRLGGNANQFNFLNDAQQFKGQHDIRRIANGNITLYDNGKSSPFHAATAKEYQLNESALTANLVWSYTENSSTYSSALGAHQRLPNGNTLINYGMLNNLNHVFNVVKPSGAKVFEIVFTDTLRSYRAFNYLTLPWALKRPVISCALSGTQTVLDAGSGYASYLWNTGATTQTIVATNTGTFSVFVPKGQGGFISAPTFTVSNLTNPCGTNSVKENINTISFNVFPNPVNDLLRINFDTQQTKVTVDLYTCLGDAIYSEQFYKKELVEISTSHLPSGLYFLNVNGIITKIIKL
ncbi:MAG: aryl-sulfate sulfotransferase [Bacteroidia bacterium]|nr:aryl-sulfate sulfotransferase [Bacteroidia bacterium]